uniref:Uncharacterized protein n=1 Tax=Anguilla anguilla TaxID=7936 RepID=A0A0E9SVC2_ANGAN
MGLSHSPLSAVRAVVVCTELKRRYVADHEPPSSPA